MHATICLPSCFNASVQVGVLAFSKSGNLLASGGLDGVFLPPICHSQLCKCVCLSHAICAKLYNEPSYIRQPSATAQIGAQCILCAMQVHAVGPRWLAALSGCCHK